MEIYVPQNNAYHSNREEDKLKRRWMEEHVQHIRELSNIYPATAILTDNYRGSIDTLWNVNKMMFYISTPMLYDLGGENPYIFRRETNNCLKTLSSLKNENDVDDQIADSISNEIYTEGSLTVTFITKDTEGAVEGEYESAPDILFAQYYYANNCDLDTAEMLFLSHIL